LRFVATLLAQSPVWRNLSLSNRPEIPKADQSSPATEPLRKTAGSRSESLFLTRGPCLPGGGGGCAFMAAVPSGPIDPTLYGILLAALAVGTTRRRGRLTIG
jgi:hypothetical protein